MTSGYTTGVNSETSTYNGMFQLTQLQVGSSALNIQYNYSATQNNGKITSQSDVISGEQIAYTYDALNRLASAQTTQTGGTQWGQSYTYDGFGNLTDQTVIKGSAPDVHVAYNASNNRQTGDTADANGNIGSGYLYDLDNRLVQPGSSSTAHYGYDVGNKRVWRGDTGVDEIAFWAGQKLATYQVSSDSSALYFTLASTNVYFGGKLISKGSYSSGSWNDDVALAPVVADRLGSIKKFYPYGTERPSATSNDTEKFTGYFRDASTGLDYADQRYHQPGVGRFMTPDAAHSARSADPATSNKYAYAGGDPVNRIDPTGRYWEDDEDYNDLFYFPDAFNEPTCLVADPAGLLSGADSGWIPCSPTSLGGGGQSTDPLRQVECEANLFYRPVNIFPLKQLGLTHTYWDVLEWDPNTSTLIFDIVIHAGPQQNTRPDGKATGPRYLNGWADPVVSSTIDNPSTGTLWWSSGWSSDNCAGVSAMVSYAGSWPNYTVAYGNSGPNSNSFSGLMGMVGGFRPPQPPGSRGWDYWLP